MQLIKILKLLRLIRLKGTWISVRRQIKRRIQHKTKMFSTYLTLILRMKKNMELT